MTRRYGRATPGQRVVDSVPDNYGTNQTMLAALSLDGLDAPWVVDGHLAVRKVCQLALSFDHRVIDGQQGSQFLANVGALLADPGLALVF